MKRIYLGFPTVFFGVLQFLRCNISFFELEVQNLIIKQKICYPLILQTTKRSYLHAKEYNAAVSYYNKALNTMLPLKHVLVYKGTAVGKNKLLKVLISYYHKSILCETTYWQAV